MAAQRSRRADGIALLLLLLLTLVVYGEFLFTSQRLLSAPNTDLAAQFLPWREFAAREMQAGNLPLWNPYLFSGAPYLGGFQAALLYPPTLLYLVLPVVTATNLTLALHTFLLGAFAYGWARGRRLSPPAAFFTGAVLMYGGATFPHLYAGHLSNFCTMAWAPLLFLAIDRVFDTRRWSAALLGMGALAMMILAGHPQYVFFTGVAAGIYTLLQWARSAERGRTAGLLVALVGGGAALAAAQLGAGWQAMGETVRSGGLSREMAAMFSFPPENFLTLLAPGFFGSMQQYWGRCYLWEMVFFISASGFLLAIYGAVATPGKQRRWAVTMLLTLCVLALGAHTPLFSFLYSYVPGFDAFRGWSKFTFQASLFLALLAGYGIEALLHRKRPPLGLAAAMAGIGFALLALGFIVYGSQSPEGWLAGWMHGVAATKESYLHAEALRTPAFLAAAASHAATACWLSGAALLLAAGALVMALEDRRWLYALLGIGVAEVLVFSWGSRVAFDVAQARHPPLQTFLEQNPGEHRTFNLQPPNAALSLGAREMWGYDPGVPRRYAEWMYFTQGANPDDAAQYLPVRQIHRLYAPMLRARFAFIPQEGQLRVATLENPGPRAFLVGSARVLPGRDALFKAMDDPGFAPLREALLEQEPEPRPESAEGSVRLVAETTDSLTLEVENPHPTLLVLTELWTPGWRVRDAVGQRAYTLLPADYILRAIPLPAGQHRLIVEYSPLAWRVGAAISLAALLSYLIAVTYLYRNSKIPRNPSPTQ